MALKAVDVTYQIPSMGELTDMLENGPISHKVTNETDENLSTFYRAGPQQSLRVVLGLFLNISAIVIENS